MNPSPTTQIIKYVGLDVHAQTVAAAIAHQDGDTSYRFYYQRPIVDPAPMAAGSAEDPVFVIEGSQQGRCIRCM